MICVVGVIESVGDVSCRCDRQGEVMCVLGVIERVGDVCCGCGVV